MIDTYGTYASGGSGSNGGDMPAGVATQAWTMENFLSIEFFSKLFKAYGPAETEGDPDVEIVPNDVEGTISNIQAMFGFWTEQYISALGQGSGGGGGGGDLNEPLASINTAGLATHPGSAGQTIIWNGSAWVYGSVLNSGVTSVGLSAPTGFNVTGSPITTSGTLALSFASGYELPLAADTAKGVTAYGWGDHSLAGYALASNVYSKTDADAKFLTIAFFRSLFKAYTSASAEVVPNAGDTTTISSIKAMFGFWTEQYISALGQGSGGGGGITLNEPLASLNNAGLAAPSSAGQTLVWNGSTWKYSNAAGISTTSLNVGGSASISGALSVAGNITTSAGGFIVSGKDNTYVLLAGGGTKLLSEIGGGGAVNSITIGQSATVYSPDANGNVNIPAYPTVPSNIVEQIVIAGTSTPYQPSSGTVTLPAYPTVPTTISSFTNDSGYITGITSSMVTTALGYTPANAASLTGYLPLSGGTLTGDLTVNALTKLKSGYFEQTNPSLGNLSVGTISINADNGAGARTEYGLYIWVDYTKGTSKMQCGYSNLQDTFPLGLSLQPLGGKVGIGYTGDVRDNSGTLSVNGSIYADSYTVKNGTSSQFLKADGSLDSTSYLTSSSLNGYATTSWVSSNFHPLRGNYSTYINALYVSTSQNESNTGYGLSLYGDYLDTTTHEPFWGIFFGRTAVFGNFGYTDGGWNTYFTSRSSAYGWVFSSYLNNTRTNVLAISPEGSIYSKSGASFDGSITTGGYSVIHSGNIASQSVTYATNSTYLYSSQSNYSYGSSTPYYARFTYNDNGDSRWYLRVYPETPKELVVDYSYKADRLTNSRELWGRSFNGTSDIVGIANFISGFFNASTPSLGALNVGTISINASTDSSYRKASYGMYLWSEYWSGSGCIQCGYENGGTNALPMHIQPLGGNVGIGTAGYGAISYKLDVEGVIYSSTGVYSAGYVTALSDIRKKDVREYMNMDYNVVADAPMIKFTWKDGRCDGKMQVGSIAQYWQRALPEAVSEMADGELSMSYGVIALLSSIATARKVREHEKRIAELEQENKELKQRLNAA